MLEAFRGRQRPPIQKEGVRSRSFLPRLGRTEFQPLGPLKFCVETCQAPGAEAVRQLDPGETFLAISLEGRIEAKTKAGRRVEATGLGSLCCTGPADLTLSNPDPQTARYVEMVLASSGLAQVVDGCASEEIFGSRPILTGPPFPKFLPLASGLGHPDCFPLALEGAVYLARLRAGENLIFETQASRRALLILISGLVQTGRFRLLPSDWLTVQSEADLPIAAVQASRFLILDLP